MKALGFLGACVALLSCSKDPVGHANLTPIPQDQRLKSDKIAAKVIAHAREQTTWGTQYDGRYVKLAYPGGDVPKERGVCTDVVVRSFRAAGYDLQKLIHEDIAKAWDAYPRYPSNKKPDRNIDHRRVPNQRVFFKRHGASLTTKTEGKAKQSWKPGDIVTWKLTGSGLDHTGVLTDKPGANGLPYVIHNLGTTLEEDVLTTWEITGHYRFPKR